MKTKLPPKEVKMQKNHTVGKRFQTKTNILTDIGFRTKEGLAQQAWMKGCAYFQGHWIHFIHVGDSPDKRFKNTPHHNDPQWGDIYLEEGFDDIGPKAQKIWEEDEEVLQAGNTLIREIYFNDGQIPPWVFGGVYKLVESDTQSSSQKYRKWKRIATVTEYETPYYEL